MMKHRQKRSQARRGWFIILVFIPFFLSTLAGCSLLPAPRYHFRASQITISSGVNLPGSQSFTANYTLDCIEAEGGGSVKISFALVDTAGRVYGASDNVLYLEADGSYPELISFSWSGHYKTLEIVPLSAEISADGLSFNFWSCRFIPSATETGVWEAKTFDE